MYSGGRTEDRQALSVEVALTRKDEYGRILTPKELFRQQCHKWAGGGCWLYSCARGGMFLIPAFPLPGWNDSRPLLHHSSTAWEGESQRQLLIPP